jgi:NTE family protein
MLQENSEAKVALVLSGGGARGIAHIGVLKVLDELDVKIDFITGTSMGAVIGALYAQGYSGKEIEEIILNKHFQDLLDDGISRENLYIGEKRWLPNSNLFFELDDNLLPSLPKSIIIGNRLTNNFFNYYFPSIKLDSFDELPIPFRAVATNIVTGKLKIFDSGNLHEAVRASMSVPSIIAPFRLDKKLYVDGGVRANFPTEIAKENGCDIIIGVRVNTGLKEESQLNTLLQIYDQTLNISINDNVITSTEFCDILITPDLESVSTFNFKNRLEIIKQGENAAKENIIELDKLPKNKKNIKHEIIETIGFEKISVEGNRYLSNSKIKEFVGLKTGMIYTKNDILEAFDQAYSSKLFDVIYPVISQNENGNILIIKVAEANRKKLDIGVAYNEVDQLVVSSTIEFNNVFQKNSKFFANVKLGGKQEINFDYVKNYGKFYGAYYRIFPFAREYETFTYNLEHEVEKSVVTTEFGATSGLGVFTKHLVLEFYGYAIEKKHHQHIAEFQDEEYYSDGFGLKLYHESLDDLIFPTRGGKIFGKISLDKDYFFDELEYYDLFLDLLLVIPLQNISIKYGLQYGNHHSKLASEFSPNDIGGLDSFLGLKPNEMNASIYQINRFAVGYNYEDKLFVDLRYNFLIFGKFDKILETDEADILHGAGVELGWKNKLLPIRLAFAVNKNKQDFFYLSIGYQFDKFFFSRK